jgi:hypothetical protein
MDMTEEQINENSNNVRLVLSALMTGERVKIGKEEYCFDINYELCFCGAYRSDSSGKKEVLIKSHIDLSTFIKMCINIDKSELALLAANNVLNDINKKPSRGV